MLWWTLQRLRSSKWQTRAEAAALLGNADEKKAAPALMEALEDGHPEVRLAVIGALTRIRHPASAEPLARRLGKLADQPKGRRESTEPNSSAAECEALARALGALGAAAVPALVRLLESGERQTRRWAANALGIARNPQAVAPLIRMLADSRSDVRKEAALALGEIRDASAVDPLIGALGSRDPETRRAAATALGAVGSEKAVDALISLSGDPNESLQLAIVEALRRIGGLRAGAGLRMMIDAGRKHVRDAALAALNALEFAPDNAQERAAAALLADDFTAALREGPAAAQALAATLESQDPLRRRRAAEALSSLRSPDTAPHLVRALRDPDLAVREAAAGALAAIGLPAVDWLIGALSHHDAGVQRLAARALGEIGDPRAAAPLAEVLEQNADIPGDYPDALEMARAAAAALGSILAAASSRVAGGELQRIAAVPDSFLNGAAASGSAPAVDCGSVREAALLELRRRS